MTYGKPFANDPFEDAGTKMLENAETFEEVRDKFNICCTTCEFREREHDCSACPIRETMLVIADAEWHKMTADDYLYVEMEKAAV